MSYKVFANDQVFDAGQVNDYLMNQTIIRVNTPADRDAIAAKTKGMWCEFLNEGILYRYNGGQWNPHRTPWLGYGGYIERGNTGNNGGTQFRYRMEDGQVHIQAWILFGSSASFGDGPLVVSLPTPMAWESNSPTSPMVQGTVVVKDPANNKMFEGVAQWSGDRWKLALYVKQVTDSFSWYTPIVQGQPINMAQSLQIWVDAIYDPYWQPYNG